MENYFDSISQSRKEEIKSLVDSYIQKELTKLNQDNKNLDLNNNNFKDDNYELPTLKL